MEVNIKKAVKMFFSSSSFEMIYFEAIANALDAGASAIDIKIQGTRDNNKTIQLQNLSLEIQDNGVGIDEPRYDKFSKLFDVEEQSHKGLGRLVYLCYFDEVRVESVFRNTNHRSFVFSESFQKSMGETIEPCEHQENGTTFRMTHFSGEKLHNNEFVRPTYLKRAILDCFYPRLYKEKIAGKDISINITAVFDGITKSEIIRTSDIPNFKEYPLEYPMGLFTSIDMYYSIKEVPAEEAHIITGIVVDDRTIPIEVIDPENQPADYEMIFLLIVKSHDESLVNASRQALNLTNTDLGSIKTTFREAIADIINRDVPKVVEANKASQEYLCRVYPHLQGYFDTKAIGYASRNDVLKKAQDRFFNDQKEILGASSTLTEEQFQKTLALSARSLAEYILFRQRIIERMKSLSPDNSEYDLHNLIAPRFNEFKEENLSDDLYVNNVWILDDKFMSYSTVLSDKEMSDVISILTNGEASQESENGRPDIALFFSGNPADEDTKVDVVIVELKKKGIDSGRISIVETQLEERARSLYKYYNKRIQRIWYYGVVECIDEYILHLKTNKYKPLFSKGKVFYNEKEVAVDVNTDEVVIANTFIMDIDAMANDAAARNETFLKILRRQFANND